MTDRWGPEIQFASIPIHEDVKLDFVPNEEFSHQVPPEAANCLLREDRLRGLMQALIPFHMLKPGEYGRIVSVPTQMSRFVPLLEDLAVTDNGTGEMLNDLAFKGLLSGIHLQTLRHKIGSPTGWFQTSHAVTSIKKANEHFSAGGVATIHPGFFAPRDPVQFVDWYAGQVEPQFSKPLSRLLISGLENLAEEGDEPAFLLRLGYHQRMRIQHPAEFMQEFLGIGKEDIDWKRMGAYVDHQKDLVSEMLLSKGLEPTIDVYSDFLRTRMAGPLISMLGKHCLVKLNPRDVGIDGRLYDYDPFYDRSPGIFPWQKPKPITNADKQLADFQPKRLSWLT